MVREGDLRPEDCRRDSSCSVLALISRSCVGKYLLREGGSAEAAEMYDEADETLQLPPLA